ncbi:DUF4383 domain-containing protein [Longispora sp. K20-0274]
MGAMSHNPVQLAAMGIGAVFALVGVLGFVPGITTHLSSITFAGHDSGALLLGTFQVSVLHNIVHLLFGVAGLAMARTWAGARMFLVAGGAVYLALWLYGLIVGHESTANFVPVNTADNWLHLALGAAMLALGTILAGMGRSGADAGT